MSSTRPSWSRIASLAILVLHVRGLVASAVLVGLAITALLVVGLAVGLAAHRLPGAERVIRWAERWPRFARRPVELRGGLAVAGRPRTLAEALVLSFLAWGATVVAFAAAGQALGIQLTMAQASLLAAGVALASAIPAGPSNLGTFDLAAVEIAATFGIDRETALALALLAHALDPDHDVDRRGRVAPGPRLEAEQADHGGRRSAPAAAPSASGSGNARRPSQGTVAADATGITTKPRPEPGLRNVATSAEAGYFTKPLSLSHYFATAATSFLSTVICLPRSVRVAVSILAETSLRIFENAALSTLAR